MEHDNFLENKGAVITGGASGFGKGVAQAFAEKGADLVLVDNNEELLYDTAKKIADKTGQKVIPITTDVANSAEVQEMAKNTFNELDNVYILFNNAGISLGYRKDFIKVDEELYDLTMNINLKGSWLVAKELGKKMKSQKFKPLSGKIINVSSIFGLFPNERTFPYSLSKAGVIAMTKMMAKTLAPKITVNCISPGFHQTGIYKDDYDTMMSVYRDGKVITPLNRVGTVEDVSDLMLFLASPASNFITGHNFPIDGGIAEVGVHSYYIKDNL
ncbi:MAG: SDR family oxidoreductase [Promethearchaeota archaeon]|nr:MAG: SDR family oxidoreductase [Candidatus Lokiarchaeota archaeon]